MDDTIRAHTLRVTKPKINLEKHINGKTNFHDYMRQTTTIFFRDLISRFFGAGSVFSFYACTPNIQETPGTTKTSNENAVVLSPVFASRMRSSRMVLQNSRGI